MGWPGGVAGGRGCRGLSRAVGSYTGGRVGRPRRRVASSASDGWCAQAPGSAVVGLARAQGHPTADGPGAPPGRVLVGAGSALLRLLARAQRHPTGDCFALGARRSLVGPLAVRGCQAAASGRGMGRRRVHATRPAPRPHPCRHPARVPCYTWCSRISISLEPRVPTNPGFNLCRPRSRRPRSRRPAGLRRAAGRDAPTDGDPPLCL